MTKGGISDRKYNTLVRCFVYRATVKQTAGIVIIDPVTVQNKYTLLRSRIVAICDEDSKLLGEHAFEEAKCYLAARIPGDSSRGRGKAPKGRCIIIGIRTVANRVHAQIIAKLDQDDMQDYCDKIADCDWSTFPKKTGGGAVLEPMGCIEDGDAHRECKDYQRLGYTDADSLNGGRAIKFITHLRSDLKLKRGIQEAHFERHLSESVFRFNWDEQSMLQKLFEKRKQFAG